MELLFIGDRKEDYVDAFVTLLKKGKRLFLIRCFTEMSTTFIEQIASFKDTYDFELIGYDINPQKPSPHSIVKVIRPRDPDDPYGKDGIEFDAAFIFNRHNVREVLCEFSGCSSDATIIAHSPNANIPGAMKANIFCSSIPKSGTHLLLELLRHFGFAPWRKLDLDCGSTLSWFGQLFTLTPDLHCGAGVLERLSKAEREFFFRHQLIFIYRDPRDLALSMHHDIMRNPSHPFRGMLSWLPTEDERLLKIIEGITLSNGYCLRSNLRDMMMPFTLWLELVDYNVIPVRFEDLIGPRGGGNLEDQLRTIWNLQLRLMIHGSPENFAEQVYNRSSLTFRNGKIGAYKKEFKPMHHDAFNALPQDFMELLGYI